MHLALGTVHRAPIFSTAPKSTTIALMNNHHQAKSRFPYSGLLIAVLIGLAFKGILLATNSITFDADEAVLALMARHILRGSWPIFFYGQYYMGALDAYLIAGAFAIFGESVLTVRLVQTLLYLGVLVTSYFLAYRLSENRFAATTTALLIAMPPVLFSLYTTATLGDYVETLLFNNLLFLIGVDLFTGRKQSPWWWLLIGFLGGLGWWGMALIVTSLIPLTIVGFWHFRKNIPWGKLALLVAGFLIGALPWLIVTIQRGFGTTYTTLSGRGIDSGLTTGFLGALGLRLFSLGIFNLPSLFGMRPSWENTWIVLPLGILIGSGYLFVLWRSIRQSFSPDLPQSRRLILHLLLGGWLALVLIFVLTPFGIDPTGRYLLPLYPLLAILVGYQLSLIQVDAKYQFIAPALLIICLGYNLTGNLIAIHNNPPGLSTQFSEDSTISHADDQDLLDFLEIIDVDRGYSTYWITFRFAFLTHEQLIFAPLLPYKTDLSYHWGSDNRYPPYTESVRQADRVVYVTNNHPTLDAAIDQRLTEMGIGFKVKHIGAYTVFYDLSRHVTLEELGPFGEVIGSPQP